MGWRGPVAGKLLAGDRDGHAVAGVSHPPCGVRETRSRASLPFPSPSPPSRPSLALLASACPCALTLVPLRSLPPTTPGPCCLGSLPLHYWVPQDAPCPDPVSLWRPPESCLLRHCSGSPFLPLLLAPPRLIIPDAIASLRPFFFFLSFLLDWPTAPFNPASLVATGEARGAPQTAVGTLEPALYPGPRV